MDLQSCNLWRERGARHDRETISRCKHNIRATHYLRRYVPIRTNLLEPNPVGSAQFKREAVSHNHSLTVIAPTGTLS